ncbi:hypothetical protein ACJ72_06689 [Emergomyces africanus]|uniref:Protein kinase domain-containing protein n=1 Tax=Emergomyces africanus TaxID=1955775 RepID=A0A1B7NQU0_9EURO|nr:hypothetical protein ACJ72_06689 [Emergomyces africanus]
MMESLPGRSSSTATRAAPQPMPHNVKFEEEELPDYNPETFFLPNLNWEMFLNPNSRSSRSLGLDIPVPVKSFKGRTICRSQSIPVTDGAPVLCDFGRARIGIGGATHQGDAMPGFYRAPEVILGVEWDCNVDIWSIGVRNKSRSPSHLFLIFLGNKLIPVGSQYSSTIYGVYLKVAAFFMLLLKMASWKMSNFSQRWLALMGSPPQSFLERSEKIPQVLECTGSGSSCIICFVPPSAWMKTEINLGRCVAATPIPKQSLDTTELHLKGEDHELFVRFSEEIIHVASRRTCLSTGGNIPPVPDAASRTGANEQRIVNPGPEAYLKGQAYPTQARPYLPNLIM